MSLKVIICSVLAFLLIGTTTLAQRWERMNIPFVVNGQSLAQATAGGLSAPQISPADLNNDGLMDLYIFDKIGQVSLTFINGGAAGETDYTFAPEYSHNFPDLNDWVLLRDYNGDGIADIFTYPNIPGIPGIQVYTGFYDNNNRIAFRQNNLPGGTFNILYYQTNTGTSDVFVSNVDIPAIDDIDGDGDLDILTFNVAGGVVEWFKNQSIEQGYGLDSLIFTLEDKCWGGFYESGISEVIDLASAAGECAQSLHNAEPRGGLHAGSTVLTMDTDADGDKEVVLGDISFHNLTLLTNEGTPENAFMTEQILQYPAQNPVDLLFPASFLLDLNNDGKRDLIAAPNLRADIAETYEVMWFYQNQGTDMVPDFQLQTKTLLIDQMLDFGTGAQPTLVDYNQDGLLDLVTGNKSYYVEGGGRDARVLLFLNRGTATAPSFELVEDDLWGMSAFSQNAWRFAPAFGDLDGDGDLDALVGEFFGNLFFLENTAGAGQAMEFAPPVFGYRDIDVGQSVRPQIVDVNRDGLLDLLIGERNGNLNYFENNGTVNAPDFADSPTNNFFGRVNVQGANAVTGYSVPALIEIDGNYQLLVGNQKGKLVHYTDIDNNLEGVFTKKSEHLGAFRVGEQIHPAFGDLDKDGFLEMVVGNIRGGLDIFKTDLQSGVSSSTTDFEVQNPLVISPNPASEQINLSWADNQVPQQVRIYNLAGQVIFTTANPAEPIDISEWTSGLYWLEVTCRDGRRFGKKWVKL